MPVHRITVACYRFIYFHTCINRQGEYSSGYLTIIKTYPDFRDTPDHPRKAPGKNQLHNHRVCIENSEARIRNSVNDVGKDLPFLQTTYGLRCESFEVRSYALNISARPFVFFQDLQSMASSLRFLSGHLALDLPIRVLLVLVQKQLYVV